MVDRPKGSSVASGSNEFQAVKACTGPCGQELPLTTEYFVRDHDKASGFKPRCKACRNSGRRVSYKASKVSREPEIPVIDAAKWRSLAEFEASIDIPTDPIPPGFSVRDVSTNVDADGNTIKQWIGSRRDGDNYEDIVPAVPFGHTLKGVSTLLDERGQTRAQWIKTSVVNDERADWLEAIKSVCDPLPRLEPTALTPNTNEDLLVVLPVGDPHVGLLSWHEDSGENFDLVIAKHRYISAFKHLVDLAPSAKEALIILIGDTAHADGQNNTTTKGTRVDVDGRTLKMARTIIEIARYAIDIASAKHGRVTMIVERGNHDELISAMIALGLSLAYEHEPRVTIDTSPMMYHWYRFGANLIGTHHGDRAKPMDLLGVMAVDRQKDWGETKHRRFYAGHIHHQVVKEVPGLIVEYLPTLASSDAWHHAMGYRSQRAMYMDIFHREHGMINRHVVGISQLAA